MFPQTIYCPGLWLHCRAESALLTVGEGFIMSLDTATTVGAPRVKRQDREELERLVQRVEVDHPGWNARAIEGELARLAPVAYGNWKDETSVERSRLRAIQRWRVGAKGRDAGKGAHLLFPYVWPVGERQRKEVDPTYEAANTVVSGSWRIFLYNCSPDVVRDVRVFLDGSEVDYAPSIPTGRFSEVHWQRVDPIRAELLSEGNALRHALRAEFVIARGTRLARIEGQMTLDPRQGWTFFGSRDGRQREIE